MRIVGFVNQVDHFLTHLWMGGEGLFSYEERCGSLLYTQENFCIRSLVVGLNYYEHSSSILVIMNSLINIKSNKKEQNYPVQIFAFFNLFH
jgi:hypothetical protein